MNQEHKGHHNKHAADGKDRNVPSKGPATHETANQSSNEGDRNKESTRSCWAIIKRNASKADWWLVIGTWTLAFFAAWTLYDIHDSSILDERAWVTAGSSALGPLEIGKPFYFSVVLANSGKTIAKNVTVSFKITFVPDRLMSELDLPFVADPLIPESVGVLAPQNKYNNVQKPKDLPLTTAEDKEKIEGSWYTYIWGSVSYHDIFNKGHITTTCSYRQGIQGDFSQCAFGNNAD